MKQNFILILFCFCLLTLTFYACNFNSQTASGIVVAEEAAVRFQCSMFCEGDKTYTDRGSCPVCHMDLVEVSLTKSDSLATTSIDSTEIH
jgi:hypothetical protein